MSHIENCLLKMCYNCLSKYDSKYKYCQCYYGESFLKSGICHSVAVHTGSAYCDTPGCLSIVDSHVCGPPFIPSYILLRVSIEFSQQMIRVTFANPDSIVILS